MLTYILKTILSLSFVFASMASICKCIHMLQLNSYQYAGYFRTVFRIRSYFIPYFFMCVFALPIALCLSAESIALPVISVIFVLFGLVRKPDKYAKKKLVYTMRVKRLVITNLCLCAIACAGIFLLKSETLFRLLPIVFYALTPFITLLANLINTPMEKAINRHYINDAKRILRSSGVNTIGITGSYGKTSVKFYLSALLTEKYDTLCTPSSFNTPLGIVRTIRSSLTPLTEVFVCEMGARHVHDIKEICDIVHPDCAVITAIGNQHLETFHTLENIKKTKLELADAVEKKCKGHVFINSDSVCDAASLPYSDIITYGTNENADYMAHNIRFSEKGMSFTVTCFGKESMDFTTRLLGSHNAVNLTGAIAVAHTYGISLESLSPRVRRIAPVEHRQELRPMQGGVIIDDAFNSNPVGAKSALDTLSCFDACKILITPGMVELGSAEWELNKEFGKQAAAVCDYVFLVGRTHTESIYEGLKEAGFNENRITVSPSFSDAMAQAQVMRTEKKKAILIENDLPDNY